MSEFQLPKFLTEKPAFLTKKFTDADFEKMTSAEWECMEAKVTEYNAALHAWSAEVRKIHANLVSAVESVYGMRSKMVEYVRSNPPDAFAGHRIDMINITLSYDIYKKAAKAREAVRAEKELLVAAAIFLTQHGKIAGTDFQPEHAVQAANDLRYDELVKEKLATGDLFDFSGQNCDDCSGWNGEDRRCNCGNRRVYWTHEGNFTNMYIYGEAY